MFFLLCVCLCVLSISCLFHPCKYCYQLVMYKTLDEMTFHLSISFSFLGGFYIIIILTVRMFINKSNTVFVIRWFPSGQRTEGGREDFQWLTRNGIPFAVKCCIMPEEPEQFNQRVIRTMYEIFRFSWPLLAGWGRFGVVIAPGCGSVRQGWGYDKRGLRCALLQMVSNSAV